MLKNLSSTGLRWLWVTILVLTLDRLSKSLALNFLIPYDPYPVMRFFNLTLAYNKGAAFSFLNNASGWQTIFFGVLAISVSLFLLAKLKQISSHQRLLSISFALIIGGALGNLMDRIYYGHVIDFLEFYVSHWHWPVFNIADSAICIGAGLLLIDAMTTKKNK